MYCLPQAKQNQRGFPPPSGWPTHHCDSRIGIILQTDLLQLYLTDTVSEIIGMKSAPATKAKSSCVSSSFAAIFSTFAT